MIVSGAAVVGAAERRGRDVGGMREHVGLGEEVEDGRAMLRYIGEHVVVEGVGHVVRRGHGGEVVWV